MLIKTINNAEIGLHEKDVILYKKFIEKWAQPIFPVHLSKLSKELL